MNKKWLFFIILFLPSCHNVKVINGKVYKKYTNYGIELPNDNWIKKPFTKTDLFFEHKTKTAEIYLNAECEHVSDSPLSALTAQLLVGFTNIQYLSRETIPIAERNALVTKVFANIDGVKRLLKIAVLRKNKCVYDAVLSMAHEDNEKEKDFDMLLKSLWAAATL